MANEPLVKGYIYLCIYTHVYRNFLENSKTLGKYVEFQNEFPVDKRVILKTGESVLIKIGKLYNQWIQFRLISFRDLRVNFMVATDMLFM